MKRYAVIGLGLLGRTVARELAARGAEVIAIDMEQELVQSMAEEVPLAVRLDSTNREALKQQGIDQVDAALVAIGENFQAAVLTTALLKEFGIPQGRYPAPGRSKRRGSSSWSTPTRSCSSRRWSREGWPRGMMSPSLVEMIELTPGMSLAKIEAFPGDVGEDPLVAQVQAALRTERRGGHQERKRRAGAPSTLLPDPEEVIEEGDVLLVDGPDEAIERMASGDSE